MPKLIYCLINDVVIIEGSSVATIVALAMVLAIGTDATTTRNELKVDIGMPNTGCVTINVVGTIVFIVIRNDGIPDVTCHFLFCYKHSLMLTPFDL